MRKDIIDALETDEQTAILVEQCYLEANKLDRSVEMYTRNNIVSIAGRGEQPRFYFFAKPDGIWVKFKQNMRGQRLATLNKQILQEQIYEADRLFKENNFKAGRKDAKSFKVFMSKYDFLNMLASGLDPISGEKLFTPNKKLSDALNSIALFVLRYDKLDSSSFRAISDPAALDEQADKIIENKKAKSSTSANVGALWTKEEDEKLVEEYMASVDIAEMEKRHGRTRSAIERRILKLVPIDKIRK